MAGPTNHYRCGVLKSTEIALGGYALDWRWCGRAMYRSVR